MAPAAATALPLRSSPAERAGWWLLAAVGLAAGVWLRVWQLDSQIIIDDEWHAIHRLLSADVSQIVTRLGYADYSVPLTVLWRLVYDHAQLSERWMHVPSVVAGIALLVVAPWLVRRWFAWPVLATWIALLAISPLLVYHAKVARPYPFTVLLAFIAIIAFRRFWLEGSRTNAIVYVVAAWIAGYLHPIVLPFVLMPLAYYGVIAIGMALSKRKRRSTRPLVRCLIVGSAVALLLAATLLPPVINDWFQFAAKTGKDDVTLESAFRTALMLAGTRHPFIAIALFALAGYGWILLRQRDADFARYLLFVGVVAAIAIAAARITWIHHPLVYARYLLPFLPFVLLLAAEGAIGAIGRLGPALRPAAVALAAIGLYLGGPIPIIAYEPNQFWGHLRFQYDYDPPHNPYVIETPKEPIPDFYRKLAALPPGSRTLIEAPWRLESNFNPHPWYQEVHRQRVRIGFVSGVCGERDFGEFPQDPGLPFRRFDHLAAVLRGETRGADYLVLHMAPWKTPPDAEIEWPDVARCVSAAQAALGAPVYRDATLVVFALKPERRHAL